MRLLRDPAVLLRGTVLAAVATAAAFLVARCGFHRVYYAAVLLPLFMAVCALAAWFFHLKDDGLARGSPGRRREGGDSPTERPEARDGSGRSTARTALDGTAGIPPGGVPIDLSLFAPRDGRLVERKSPDAGPRGGPRPEGEESRRLRGVFLCAAVELGLLATALYFVAGLGAGYFF